ncbi:MAG: hypothetical protein IKK34_13790 [Clostridia bacterium]|nr:hypothetical protein [Clostridia bacterium]
MFQLFPSIKKRMLLLCGLLLAMLGVFTILYAGISPIALLLIAVIGVLVIIALQYTSAVATHNQLLAILYDQLNPAGFLIHYEPLLRIPVKNPNLSLMVHLHTSNAYCAQGRFDDAQALLSSFPIKPGKKREDELLTRFAIVSNLCYCAEQKNDVETAKRHLADLLAIKEKLEALQKNKPEKKRMVFSTELNEQCLKFLTTGKANIETLKTLSQNNSQLLHKVTISLWVARAYLAVNNRREAEKLLERIVNVASDLYPGKVAADLLAQLPEKKA